MNVVANSRQKKKIETFMQICTDLSNLSHDSTYKVAAIIVTDDFKEICAIGYNGDYAGGPNARYNHEKGKSGFLHAEENALFHLGKPLNDRDNLILLCTHKPCTMCAKRIVNSGIKRVVWRDYYADEANETDTIFLNSDVGCVSFAELHNAPVRLNEFLKHTSK